LSYRPTSSPIAGTCSPPTCRSWSPIPSRRLCRRRRRRVMGLQSKGPGIDGLRGTSRLSRGLWIKRASRTRGA
jgi:hypothetical protein